MDRGAWQATVHGVTKDSDNVYIYITLYTYTSRMYMYVYSLKKHVHSFQYYAQTSQFKPHNVCMKTVSEFQELYVTIHPDLSKLDNTISHANVWCGYEQSKLYFFISCYNKCSAFVFLVPFAIYPLLYIYTHILYTYIYIYTANFIWPKVFKFKNKICNLLILFYLLFC